MQTIWKSSYLCVVLMALLLLGVAPASTAKALGLADTGAAQRLPFQPNEAQAATKKLSTPQLIDQALANGEITADQRLLYLAYALYEPTSLPLRFSSNVGWYGTPYVWEVQNLSQSVHAAATDAVQRELDRLDALAATVCDQDDGANSSDSTNFHFNYDTIVATSGLTIADYKTSMETTFNIEVTQFGWANPPLCTGGDTCDGNVNPYGKYPVRIFALGNSLYGYVTTGGTDLIGFIGDNPNTPGVTETDAVASCMVLNDNFSLFPEGSQGALDSTTSHEFVHAIQNGYGDPDPREDAMWYESSAAYMEDEIFDSANSDYQYLWPEVSNCLGEWPNNGAPGGVSQYSNFLFFRHVAENNGGAHVVNGGENVMQHAWENIGAGQSGLDAYSSALVTAGTNLPDAFHKYAIAAKFEKACGAGYAAPYCFAEGAAYVTAVGSLPPVTGSIAGNPGTYGGSADNNYAANWVSLPTSGPYKVTLSATGGQLRGSLVCDTGSSFVIAPFASVVSAGGSTSIGAFDPTGCTSVVAVITNQEQTESDPTSCTANGYTLSVDTEQKINSSITQQPSLSAVYDGTPQTCAATGTSLAFHTVTPTIRNTSASTFNNLVFRVKQLEYKTAQGGSQPSLCNASTVVSGGGVGSTFNVANSSLPGSDNQFNPTDDLITQFKIGLPVRAAYRFFVDLYSASVAAANANDAGQAEEYLGSFEYEFDADGQLVGQYPLFLPLVTR